MAAITSAIFCFFIFLGVLALPIQSADIDYLEKGYRYLKKTHIRFFMQDILSGPNATAIEVASGTETSGLIGFGKIFVIDDDLTDYPSPLSKKIGKAQGFYVDVSQNANLETTVLQLYVTFVFTEEMYNGSTISILANDPTNQNVREFAILGGTGKFRMARGYILWSTFSLNSDTDGTLEANAYIYQY